MEFKLVRFLEMHKLMQSLYHDPPSAAGFIFLFVFSFCLILFVMAEWGHQSFVSLVVANSISFKRDDATPRYCLPRKKDRLVNVTCLPVYFFSSCRCGGRGSRQFFINQGRTMQATTAGAQIREFLLPSK